MNLKNQKDFFSGVLLMAAGAGFAWRAAQHSLGSVGRLGPGYFPLLLAALLTLLGALISFKALVFETEDGGRIGRWALRPALCIVAANLAFGLLLGGLPSIELPPMGLVAAIVTMTILAALAGAGFRWREVLVMAAVLSLGSYVLFIRLLKLNLPLWPEFSGT